MFLVLGTIIQRQLKRMIILKTNGVINLIWFKEDTVMGQLVWVTNFVKGWYDTSCCKVFESNSNVFTEIKKVIQTPKFDCCQVVSIGYKIVAFATILYNHKLHKSFTKVLYIYDVLKGQWSLEEIKLTNNREEKSCTKVPVV